jgi:NarL family two-component system response regulator LiaR
MVHAASQPPAPGHDLTERERTVLALMVEGLNNTEIAAKLVVSPSTIKSHVSHILRKLDVASRTEAVALAVRHHLVD